MTTPDMTTPNQPLTKSQIDLRRRWADDLCGSVQATGVLYDGTGYCCLGRLCSLEGAFDEEMYLKLIPEATGMHTRTMVGSVAGEVWDIWNDGTGTPQWSHPEIALYIYLSCEEAENP